jgi:DNA-binding NarL/FixJ family response regulator
MRELMAAHDGSELSEQSAALHAALETTIGACLSALAELAGSTGQTERGRRLREAIGALHTGVPAVAGQAESPGRGEPDRTTAREACGPLTPRELQIAAMIVEGLANRNIARTLSISERTADTHVRSILNKLGLSSRVQVAAWFVRRGSLNRS